MSDHPHADPRAAREFRADDEPPVDPRQSGEMPFLSHLDELRRVLQICVLAAVVGAAGGWWFAPRVLADLIARTVQATVVLSPFEAFNERLKLAFVLGLAISLPVILWQVWSFVVPGLFRRERGWVLPMVFASLVLFAGGAWASYAVVVPLVIKMLRTFLTPGMVEQIRLGSLLDFVYNLSLACGILAQLPLVTMVLTGIGLVTPMFLLRQWRVAMVAIFLVTALITPGDLVSAQLMLGAPMVVLYFASVLLSFLVAKRKRREESDVVGAVEEGVKHVQ